MLATRDDRPGSREFQQLLRDARLSSGDALGVLLESQRNYLLWLASHELSPDVRAKGGASDIVQQTFLHAHAQITTFRGDTLEQWQSWLRSILLNTLSNFHRQYCRTEKRRVSWETSLGAASSIDKNRNDLTADGGSPSSVVRHAEENERLMAILKSLPPDYRDVIELRYWDRLTFHEIGERMDRSAEAARKLWARAFERLERQLEHLVHEFSSGK